MKRLLLIVLAAIGIAFVPVHNSDAQVYVGVPGIGIGVGVGYPSYGYYYGYPRYYGYYPSSYYGILPVPNLLLFRSLVLLVQRASLLSTPSTSSLLLQLLSCCDDVRINELARKQSEPVFCVKIVRKGHPNRPIEVDGRYHELLAAFPKEIL